MWFPLNAWNTKHAIGFFRVSPFHIFISSIYDFSSNLTLLCFAAIIGDTWSIVIVMDEHAVVSIAAVPSLVESAVHIVGVEAGLAIPTGPRNEVPVVNVQDSNMAIRLNLNSIHK